MSLMTRRLLAFIAGVDLLAAAFALFLLVVSFRRLAVRGPEQGNRARIRFVAGTSNRRSTRVIGRRRPGPGG